MSTDSTWVAPVVADGEQPLPYPPQFIMPAPAAPAEVTEAIGALRAACAQWATPSATSVEVRACDAALGRDLRLQSGVGIGVTATLLAVAYAKLCRDIVHAPTYSPAGDGIAYAGCALAGLLPGLLLGVALIAGIGDAWSYGKADAVAWASTIGCGGLLGLIRWLYVRRPLA